MNRPTGWCPPILVVLILSYAFIGYTVSRRFPPVYSDEAFFAVLGHNLISGSGERYSLFDDVFAPSVAPLRDAFPLNAVTVYNGWVGIWTRLLGRTYKAARASSCAAGILVLCAFYHLGVRLKGTTFGLLLVLLVLSDPVFLLGSLIVRPEVLFLLSSILILWMIVGWRERVRWKSVLIGAACGIQVGIHPNALPLVLGFVGFYSLYEPLSVRKILGGLFGFGAAGLSLLLTVDLKKLLLTQKTFFAALYRPPILSWPWSPSVFLHHAIDLVTTSQAVYFQNLPTSGWTLALRIHAAGTFLSLIGLAVCCSIDEMTERWARACLGGLFGSLLGMLLCMAKYEALYRLALYPFLIPLVALFLSHPSRTIFAIGTKAAVLLLFLTSLAVFGRFSFRSTRGLDSFDQVLQKVHTLVPDSQLKLIGPNTLWFGWDPERFRDLGAMMYSRWYTGGRRDLGAWLKPWHPDILIADEAFHRMFVPQGTSPAQWGALLGAQVDYVGAVDTGEKLYGRWDIYRIHWLEPTVNS